MKIVQVIPELKLAGAEIMCENLSYELKKLGHEVIVASLYNTRTSITERLERSGIKVEFLGKKRGFDLSMIFKIKRVLKKEKADAVHTHLHVSKYVIPAAIMAGVKHRVHTVHNIAEKENGKFARKLNKFFFKRFNLRLVALSELIRESITKEYKINSDRIPVIFNGIDLSKCIPKNDYSTSGNFKILHIGRFSEQKNHEGLIKAFELFHKKYPDSELWLIGDGEKRQETELYVANSGLNGYVEFLGLQSNVYQYLENADMFTLPSNYEGVPMTLIEAMGTGLPIVATAVGGVPDMLDESCAILTNVDSNEIADAFERLYLSEGLRETCGKNAFNRSCDFSSKIMAEKYTNLYRDVT